MHLLDVLLFSLVLSLVLPPCFLSAPAAVTLAPSAGHALLCAAAAAVLLRYKKALLPSAENTSAGKAVTAGAAMLSFGILCVSSALMSAASSALQKADVLHDATSISRLPASLMEFLLCAASFMLSAFYEETIYRLYLPAALRRVFAKARYGKMIAEAAGVLLFAFAHKYSGGMSIVNALIAAAALRMCVVRGKSLAAAMGVHTAYNMLQLALIILSSRA